MHSITPILVSLLTVYIVSCLVYVYRFRGQQRFPNMVTYFRKGWPIFTPLNCFLYLCTDRRQRKPVIDTADLSEFKLLRDNVDIIKTEAQQLRESGYFDRTKDRDSAAYYDMGFRSFYKYGWGKFYLKWYGYEHASARQLCPQTQALLRRVPAINGAMFTQLPPGSKLMPHMDPMACSLRYHLALDTPNSKHCFINVDGQHIAWQDGEDLLFDETYIHFARNDTQQDRLILLCDVERSMNLFGRAFNTLYKWAMRATVVPNAPQDRSGLANHIFYRLKYILAAAKQLKQRNRPLYLCLKYALNLGVLAVLGLVLVWLPLQVLGLLVG